MSKRIQSSIQASSKLGSLSGFELILADLLKHGTTMASLVIGIGLLLNAIHWDHSMLTGSTVIKIGIALFILLPVLRVTLMLAMFVRVRDRHFAAIATVVLLFIVTSFVLGMAMPKALPG